MSSLIDIFFVCLSYIGVSFSLRGHGRRCAALWIMIILRNLVAYLGVRIFLSGGRQRERAWYVWTKNKRANE